jgi:hypothetical protein
MALDPELRAMGAVSVLWASSGRYQAVLMASGFILLREVEEMIRIPFPAEGELAKAAARAAGKPSRREFGC